MQGRRFVQITGRTPLIKKRSVALLFGGRSAEHDVSIMSATNVMQAIDQARYDIVPIKIGREGRWALRRPGPGGQQGLDGTEGIEVALLPGSGGTLVAASTLAHGNSLPKIDVVLPMLHGPFGEDGTVQGLAEIANVAYVGCGVASSAVCMDKDLTKRLLVAAGIAMACSITVRRGDIVTFEGVERQLGMPVFVKPARQGSSFGVGKADSPDSLEAALRYAFEHDDKLLIEEFVPAREIECAVLERPDGSLVVSDPGEIVTDAAHKFYTYEAKYVDTGGTVVTTPADVSDHVKAECRDMAAKAFRALECSGMARVDFFLRFNGSLSLNEVNTIPGFTNMSMFPRALEASGISYAAVVETLIQTALARHAQTARLYAKV